MFCQKWEVRVSELDMATAAPCGLDPHSVMFVHSSDMAVSLKGGVHEPGLCLPSPWGPENTRVWHGPCFCTGPALMAPGLSAATPLHTGCSPGLCRCHPADVRTLPWLFYILCLVFFRLRVISLAGLVWRLKGVERRETHTGICGICLSSVPDPERALGPAPAAPWGRVRPVPATFFGPWQ